MVQGLSWLTPVVQLMALRANAGNAERGVEEGIIIGSDDQAGKIAGEFIKGIAQHRHWGREKKLHPPT